MNETVIKVQKSNNKAIFIAHAFFSKSLRARRRAFMIYSILMESLVFSEEARRILHVLTEYYRPEKVIVFGSFARGEENLESDLDVCIIKDQVPVSSVERRFEVYRLLEDRKIPVDVIVYRPKEFKERLDLGDPFIKTLVNEGKVVYG